MDNHPQCGGVDNHTVWWSGMVVRALDSQLRGAGFKSNFTPLCLSDGTLKPVTPFYPVSMPGEVKDPTQVNV